MCTAITLQTKQMENYFGRTMDFSYEIDPSLYVIPQNYTWNNVVNGQSIHNPFAFLGIGQLSDGLLAFFDGVNEAGFAAAALYFAGYAKFHTQVQQGKEGIASFDFLHYLLGRCRSVKDLPSVLSSVSLVGIPDPVTQSVAPLHWIAADASGDCAVIEQTENGLRVYRNAIGVLTNSPDFPWHMTNLRNYMSASPKQLSQAQWGNVVLTPFGQGGGTMPLPGGYTAPERFVRTAYLKTHIQTPSNRLEAIHACFHILSSVTIPKGAVITDRNTYDFTKYTAFIHTKTSSYFFKTYDNDQIATASLFDHNLNSSRPIVLGKLKRPVVFEKIQ